MFDSRQELNCSLLWSHPDRLCETQRVKLSLFPATYLSTNSRLTSVNTSNKVVPLWNLTCVPSIADAFNMRFFQRNTTWQHGGRMKQNKGSRLVSYTSWSRVTHSLLGWTTHTVEQDSCREIPWHALALPNDVYWTRSMYRALTKCPAMRS